MTTTSLPTSIGSPRFARFMKSTPYWTPSRSAPGTSRATAFMAPAVIATASTFACSSSKVTSTPTFME
jgi:hypothetical protein